MGLVKGLVAAGTMLVKAPVMAGADCKENPRASVHVKITLVPEGMMVSCGVLTEPNGKLNTVPPPPVPPFRAVPKSVLPDRISPADDRPPPVPPVKLCRVVKPAPLVLSRKTVPLAKLSAENDVPFSVLPDKINSPIGNSPFLLVALFNLLIVQLDDFHTTTALLRLHFVAFIGEEILQRREQEGTELSFLAMDTA